ncbi:MAG: inositol monophosphatase [Gemmatimonadetes bacterium]|nr:inositol monophosphatase [Gemmatimonadota bacterium]
MAKYYDLVRLARSAAERGARYVRQVARPGDPAQWDKKGQHDFVTSVDREAERLVAETLTQGEPGSVVMGEELSPGAAQADLVWVVDPLDGTTNYLHGYPQYAVSIGGVVHGELVIGVVADIARDLTYHGASGEGAWCGERRLQVSSITDPDMSLIGTGFPFRTPPDIPRYLRQFTAVTTTTSGIRRAGAAALDLVDVALGRLDGFWEMYLAPWDVAAGTLLIREAGGVVTDMSGSPHVVAHGSIVAGNAVMHAWLRNTLERV